MTRAQFIARERMIGWETERKKSMSVTPADTVLSWLIKEREREERKNKGPPKSIFRSLFIPTSCLTAVKVINLEYTNYSYQNDKLSIQNFFFSSNECQSLTYHKLCWWHPDAHFYIHSAWEPNSFFSCRCLSQILICTLSSLPFFLTHVSFEYWTINKLMLSFECGIPRPTRTRALRCGNTYAFATANF
jgi:hypothetical protein